MKKTGRLNKILIPIDVIALHPAGGGCKAMKRKYVERFYFPSRESDSVVTVFAGIINAAFSG
jgi:hypothetical protein